MTMAGWAEDCVRADRHKDARDWYSLAANAEQLAVTETPLSKWRTLGILAVSHVSLLYKAGRFADADAAAMDYLFLDSISTEHADQLRELRDLCKIEIDPIGVLFRLVKEAGGNLTLYGKPIATAAELRSEMQKSAVRRLTNIVMKEHAK